MLVQSLDDSVNFALVSSQVHSGDLGLFAHLVKAEEADLYPHVFQNVQDCAILSVVEVSDAMQVDLHGLDQLIKLYLGQEVSELLYVVLKVKVIFDFFNRIVEALL